MRHRVLFSLSALAVCLSIVPQALAGSPDAAKYPLRVYIFRFAVQPSHSREPKHPFDMPDYVSGMGQADLFENGEPRGFQFNYSCTVEMRASGSYSTFPARWKKHEKTLEILLPRKGTSEDMESCDLQAEMMPGQVFFWKDGVVSVESSALLKSWMVKHKFDPESSDEQPDIAGSESAASNPFLSPED